MIKTLAYRKLAFFALAIGPLLIMSEDANATTRGIRNNNPGNIRKSNIQWDGADGDDGTFVKFSSPEYGIRALARILKVYNSKYGLDTVTDIIHRWAPPNENQSDHYADFVANKIGHGVNDPLDFSDADTLIELVTAIIQFENGSVPYDPDTISKGVGMA